MSRGEDGERPVLKLLGRRIDTRAAGLNHFTFLLEAWDRKTGEDVTPQLHDAVDRLEDDDGETFAFVKHLHDRFGAIVATSDSHAGEYFRSAREYTEPLDIAERQNAMRSMIDEVVDAIVAGSFDLEPFLRWVTDDPLRPILRAAISGTPERVASAILPNDDLIPGAPRDSAVEVSATATAAGIVGDRSDDLPIAIAGSLHTEVTIQQLVADAALLGLAFRRAAGARARSGRRLRPGRGADPRRLRGRAPRSLAGASLSRDLRVTSRE